MRVGGAVHPVHCTLAVPCDGAAPLLQGVERSKHRDSHKARERGPVGPDSDSPPRSAPLPAARLIHDWSNRSNHDLDCSRGDYLHVCRPVIGEPSYLRDRRRSAANKLQLSPAIYSLQNL